MNSFNAMSRAIDFEIDRQTALIRAGKGDEIVQETRTWDEGRQCTVSMRKLILIPVAQHRILDFDAICVCLDNSASLTSYLPGVGSAN